MKGILGRKSGMTTVFMEDGTAMPVTVVEIKENVVLQVKTVEKDGYTAIKLGLGDKKENKSIKPEIGQAKKAKTSPKYFIKEIKNMDGFKLGDKINSSIFKDVDLIDVTGTSKGKGFQGSIKRHNQSIGPKGHGSKSHRVTGSLGSITGKVFKTKKMPGHMGHEQTTMQNLKIIDINSDLNIILIKGSIPGPNKSYVILREAIKGQDEKYKKVNLLNFEVERIKNDLVEDAKKVNAKVNSRMSVDEMKEIIKTSTETYNKNIKEREQLLKEAKELKINKAEKMKLADLKIEVQKVKKLVENRKKKEKDGGK